MCSRIASDEVSLKGLRLPTVENTWIGVVPQAPCWENDYNDSNGRMAFQHTRKRQHKRCAIVDASKSTREMFLRLASLTSTTAGSTGLAALSAKLWGA
ncbi:hypothetical protein KC325_g193 [Hortaea werneckii]|nr:hypothetical protein KC325_g193 [Hortaea werneckii]